MQASQKSLDCFKKNPKDFTRIFVTADENWVHYFTLETKEQSKQWMHSDSLPPKSVKSILSAGKCMDPFFWDAKGILLLVALKLSLIHISHKIANTIIKKPTELTTPS